MFFPNLLDIKSFSHEYNRDGGLAKLADSFNLKRQGTMHQAGSDSLVTLRVFFALFNNLESEKDKKEYGNMLKMYNCDIYGFQNEQAYVSMNGASPYRQPMSVYGN